MSSLSQEFCAIRKERKLSIQDVYEKTRIAIETIEAIEDGSIFSEHEKGKPYLRSFIRTYGKALQIKEDDIIQALDANERGEYQGMIRKKYLEKDTSNRTSSKTDQSRKTEAEEERPKLSLRRGSGAEGQGSDSSKSSGAASQKDEVEQKDQNLKRTPATSSIDIPDELDKPDLSREHNQTLSDRPNVKNVDWAHTVKKAEYSSGKRSSVFLGVAIVILLIAGAGASLYFGFGPLSDSIGGGSPDEPVEQQTAETGGLPALPDTLVANEESELPETETETDPAETEETAASPDAEAPETLPDTLELVIVAADGVLEPVRILSDIDNTLRPYWVELGDGLTASFVDQIEIRGQFNRMTLLFNGHPVENLGNYMNEEGFVELRRSLFQQDEIFTTPAEEGEYEEDLYPDSTDEIIIN